MLTQSPRRRGSRADAKQGKAAQGRHHERMGMTDAALAELLKVQRRAIGAMRKRGTLTTRVARELPQLEPSM